MKCADLWLLKVDLWQLVHWMTVHVHCGCTDAQMAALVTQCFGTPSRV